MSAKEKKGNRKKNRGQSPIFLRVARGHHDMGGLPAGKVEPAEHDYDEWERRVDALMVLCIGITGEKRGKKRLMTADEKWITSLTQTLIQRGVITTAELARKMGEVGKRA